LTGTGEAGKIYTVPCVATGRYVKITATRNTFLTMCEVEVSGRKSCVRPQPDTCQGDGAASVISDGKPATQSSTYPGAVASRAVDGNYNAMWFNGGTCASTNGEDYPWWQVDLQDKFALTQVRIWNRQDCCPDRLLPLKVEVSSDGSTWNPCGSLTGTGEAGKIYTVPCVATGRYVKITATRNTYLTMCEVEVSGSKCVEAPIYHP